MIIKIKVIIKIVEAKIPRVLNYPVIIIINLYLIIVIPFIYAKLSFKYSLDFIFSLFMFYFLINNLL